MAAPNRAAKPESSGSRKDPAVIAFLLYLDHPLKKEFESLRRLILGVSPKVCEGIKWNAPSFRTTDYFATINVHGKDLIRIILHKGARVKDNSSSGMKIADPQGLLQWLAKDRCLITLGGGKDFLAKRAALKAIFREWIRQI
jgi:hypothetical protein